MEAVTKIRQQESDKQGCGGRQRSIPECLLLRFLLLGLLMLPSIFFVNLRKYSYTRTVVLYFL